MRYIADGNNIGYYIGKFQPYSIYHATIFPKSLKIPFFFNFVLFLKNLEKTLNITSQDERIVVFDSAGEKWRTKFLPKYKESRKDRVYKKPILWKTFMETLSLTKDLVNGYTPWIAFSAPSYLEADDANAILAQDVESIIIANDKDYNQLVHYGVKIYNIKSKKLISDDKYKKKERLNLIALLGAKDKDVPPVRKRLGEATINRRFPELLDDPLSFLSDDEVKQFKINFALLTFEYVLSKDEWKKDVYEALKKAKEIKPADWKMKFANFIVKYSDYYTDDRIERLLKNLSNWR